MEQTNRLIEKLVTSLRRLIDGKRFGWKPLKRGAHRVALKRAALLNLY